MILGEREHRDGAAAVVNVAAVKFYDFGTVRVEDHRWADLRKGFRQACRHVVGWFCSFKSSDDFAFEKFGWCRRASAQPKNGGRGEIGRASCRERVCQYVYIFVVAVSLNKKFRTSKHITTA